MVERRYLYYNDTTQGIEEAGGGDTPAGLNRDSVERNTLLSTNSVPYVNYLTLNYIAEADGQFKVDQELIWNTDKANRDVSIELTIDGLQEEEVVERVSNPATNLRIPTTQVHLVNLTAGAHTIEVNVKVQVGSQTLDVYHGDLFVERWDIPP